MYELALPSFVKVNVKREFPEVTEYHLSPASPVCATALGSAATRAASVLPTCKPDGVTMSGDHTRTERTGPAFWLRVER